MCSILPVMLLLLQDSTPFILLSARLRDPAKTRVDKPTIHYCYLEFI